MAGSGGLPSLSHGDFIYGLAATERGLLFMLCACWPGPAVSNATVSPAQALRGTVIDFPGFDERADAETLRKAMKGLGKSRCLCVLPHGACVFPELLVGLQ